MQQFEIILSVISVVVAMAGLLLVYWIVRTSGRDRPRDPARVQRLVDKINRYDSGEVGLSD